MALDNIHGLFVVEAPLGICFRLAVFSVDRNEFVNKLGCA